MLMLTHGQEIKSAASGALRGHLPCPALPAPQRGGGAVSGAPWPTAAAAADVQRGQVLGGRGGWNLRVGGVPSNWCQLFFLTASFLVGRVVPKLSLPFFGWEGSTLLKVDKKGRKLVPTYSSLSTGGPSCSIGSSNLDLVLS